MPLEARGSSMGIGRGSASLARLLRRASAARGGAAAGPRGAPPAAAAPPPLGAAPARFPAAAAPAAARLLARAASSRSRAAAAAAAEPAAAPAADAPAADAAAAAEEPGAGLTMADLPTSDESDALLRVRHSCAHLMAMAVQRLHKGAQCTIGPWTERGFFYDFSMPGAPLADKDLPKIRKEMQRLVRKDLPIKAEEVAPAEARARIEAAGEPFKLEILDSILARDPAAPITIYHIGAEGERDHWWDLCAGPHVASTGAIDPEAFDLESTAGAYWRGDDTRPMLSRVSGTAWADAGQLAAYRRLRAEAARRDHRRLGAELDLFSIREEAGGGLVFWHPKGAMVRHLIETFWKEAHLRRGCAALGLGLGLDSLA
jgi:threonyl-tRNA synthetase